MVTKTKQKLTGSDAEYGYKFGCDGTMSVQEAAKHMGVSDNTIRRCCDDGRLRDAKLPNAVGLKTRYGKRLVCTRSVNNLLEQAKN